MEPKTSVSEMTPPKLVTSEMTPPEIHEITTDPAIADKSEWVRYKVMRPMGPRVGRGTHGAQGAHGEKGVVVSNNHFNVLPRRCLLLHCERRMTASYIFPGCRVSCFASPPLNGH